MTTYPVKRIKLSNEYIMTYVFIILVMYQLPWWFKHPSDLVGFIVVLLTAIIIDTVIGLKRNHAIKCSVSSAVTVGIIFVIFPSITIWGGLLAIAIAMLGKHLLGGTGKNSLNPAIIGVLVLSLLFKNEPNLFNYNNLMYLIVPLSLPLILLRPYAVIGWISGMSLSMYLSGDFTVISLMSIGVFFWGCMVITDPVTVNHHPIMGLILFALAFKAINYNLLQMSLLILIINIISLLIEKIIVGNNIKIINRRIMSKLKSPYVKVIPYEETKKVNNCIDSLLTSDVILNKIREHEVVGLGGGAFPTHQKIRTVMNAEVKEKYLLVNAVECDPGLLHDVWLVRKFNLEITKSIELLEHCMPGLKVIMASKSLKNLNYPENIILKKVANVYPMGSEKELIKYILNKEKFAEVIPAKNGILVLNVQTLLSIYDAVLLNKKASSKYITIGNLIKSEARIMKVTLGDKVSDILKEENPEELVFLGGGMMQSRHVGRDELIDINTNFIGIGNMPRYKEGICSKCGLCVVKCPSGLEVSKIAELMKDSEYDNIIRYHPEKCISCGLCSYYCLAGKNLSEQIKNAALLTRL